jgi:hypothetical protein
LEPVDHAYGAIRVGPQVDQVVQAAAERGYSAASINQICNHPLS